MNPDARIELVICGVLLIGLSLMVDTWSSLSGRYLCSRLWLGACCVWCGVRRGAALGQSWTLLAAAGVLAWEGVKLWITAADAQADYRAAVVMTVLVAFCVGTLANVLQRGGRREERERG